MLEGASQQRVCIHTVTPTYLSVSCDYIFWNGLPVRTENGCGKNFDRRNLLGRPVVDLLVGDHIQPLRVDSVVVAQRFIALGRRRCHGVAVDGTGRGEVELQPQSRHLGTGRDHIRAKPRQDAVQVGTVENHATQQTSGNPN